MSRRRRSPRPVENYTARCGHAVDNYLESTGICDACVVELPKLPETFTLRAFDGSPGLTFTARPRCIGRRPRAR